MLRVLLATAMFLGTGAVLHRPASATSAMTGSISDAAPPHVQQGTHAVDDAITAALIRAIASQLGPHGVAVRLGRLDVAPAGPSQRDIGGEGQLRIDNDDNWIAFRFHALYDDEQATAETTEFSFGDDRARWRPAADSPLAGRLDQDLSRRLKQEFPQQHVVLALDTVESSSAGGHYLVLHAQGRADFGGDGQAGTDVHALYDTRSGQWLQLDYRLDDTAAGDALEQAVALR